MGNHGCHKNIEKNNENKKEEDGKKVVQNDYINML